jgi:transposase InsO family protein
VKELLGWTQKQTAGCFDLASNTIARWESESKAHPEQETIGSLVKPEPPVRRFADVVRHLVQTVAASGFGGNERIAQTLARAGWKLATETVRRIRNEKPAAFPPEAPAEAKPLPIVKARYPNQVAMADLTDIPSLFRLFSFKLAVVLDVFSRFPLAARVFRQEPSGPEMAALVREAIERFGPPSHFVSDRGPQFTSADLRDVMRENSVSHRFGALGKTGSIALIERFWRSAKSLVGLPLLPPLTQAELERRVELALFYYAYLRPHQGLGGATPAEVFFELAIAHREAVSPPRARPHQGPFPAPFRVGHLDPEQLLPVLLPNDVAA